MNKRPLCLFGISLIFCIWLGEALGITHFRDPRPDPEVEKLLKKETSLTLTGQVYQLEEKESYIVYYVKHSFLVQSDQSNSLKNVKVIWKAEAPRYPMGSYLQIKGKLGMMEKADNPGQFDARSYYAARNVRYQIYAEEIMQITGSQNWFAEIGYDIRCYLQESLSRLVSPEKAGIFAAMLLGKIDSMDPEWKMRFQMGGISHITAISGLHISFLGTGIFLALCKLGTPIPAAAVLSGILLGGYSLLTGGSISTLRALFMFLAAIFAKVLGRTYDMLSALSLSAIVLVLLCPARAFDCSFLLSYSAVLGIGVLFPVWMRDKIEGKQSGILSIRRYLTVGLKSGTAIFLMTCPIILYYFFELSLYGIVLNLLVLPTAGIVLVSGLLGSGVGIFSLLLGKLAILPGSILLDVYYLCCRCMTQLPAGICILGRPKIWKILFYYAVLFLACQVWRSEKSPPFWRKGMYGILGMVFLFLFVWHPRSELEAAFLDVGQGDSVVVTSPQGHTYLLDGGSSSEKKVGQYRILPYLKCQGIRQVDYMLVSHTDADHTGGLEEILRMIAANQTSLKVKYLLLPDWEGAENSEDMRNLREAGEQAGCRVIYVKRGDCIREKDMQLTCLHPGEKDGIDYVNQTNEGSQVWKLEYGKIQALFTGDVEGEGETKLLETLEAGQMDFLKVAHHGSNSSTTEAFLQKTMPKIAVISCGENNSYGHPHPEVLDRLRKSGSVIFKTPDTGAITIRCDGEKPIVTFQKMQNSVYYP
jgi:competence protein ComEC